LNTAPAGLIAAAAAAAAAAVSGYCSCRNIVGGVGPVAVAKLAEVVGLQHAMLLAPACYVASGLIFLVAEKEIEYQQKQAKLLAAESLSIQQQQQQ
jgi:hypothetical protein